MQPPPSHVVLLSEDEILRMASPAEPDRLMGVLTLGDGHRAYGVDDAGWGEAPC